MNSIIIYEEQQGDDFHRFFSEQTLAGARRPQFVGRHQSEKVISVSE